MYYQSKRNFLKNWLGNTNLKPYIFIIIAVFCLTAAVLFVGEKYFAAEPSKENNIEPTTAESETFEDLTEPATQPPIVEGYLIRVNKADNTVVFWKTENDIKTKIEKVMTSSVNENLQEGIYEISEKNIWRKLPNLTYTQYSAKSTEGILFHSPIYEIQNRGYLLVHTYRMIGKTNDTVEGITLTVGDAKWIFENCIEGTKVEVYTDSNEEYPMTPQALMEIPDGIRWDPTDPNRSNMWVQGKIKFLNGVTDKTIPVGGSVDPWDGIYARTEDGRNVTNNVVVRNYVNNQVPGVYSIEYIMADSTGQVIRQFSSVTVE